MLKITDGYKKDIDNMVKDLTERQKLARTQANKAVTVMAQGMETDIKKSMRDTEVNTLKSYGKHGHHPSVAGDYPAPDTGLLMRSITHSIKQSGDEIRGYTGSNIIYAKYLEYGTSKMKPRPFLIASKIKLQSWFREVWIKYMEKVIK